MGDLQLADQEATFKILEIFTPADLSAAEMIEGTPPEQAAVALKKIREVL